TLLDGFPRRASAIRTLASGLASPPEVGAGCGNPVRPDLWRGLRATVIPTPTNRPAHSAGIPHPSGHFGDFGTKSRAPPRRPILCIDIPNVKPNILCQS